MVVNRPGEEGKKPDRSVRASVSFPVELYRTLEDLAKKKKVSIAWVVREAVEQYIGHKWPLFRHKSEEQE